MKIGRKVILALLASSTVVLVGFGVLASKLVLDGHRELEDAQIRSDTMRAADSTSNEIQVVANKLQDWAVWDDSYEYLLGKGPEFERRNITPAAFSGLSLCGMAFFDLKGEPVVARTFRDEALEPMPFSITAAITEAIDPLKVVQSGESRSGLVYHENHVYIVAAAPVVPSAEDKPPSGTIVFVREVEQSLLAQVCRLTKLDVAMFRCDEVAAFANKEPASLKKGMTLVEEADDSISGWTTLHDTHDQPVLFLKATTRREILLHASV